MCVDSLFCLVMSFLPPAVTPKVELQNVQNANPERKSYTSWSYSKGLMVIFWTSLQLLLRTENDVRIESEGI